MLGLLPATLLGLLGLLGLLVTQPDLQLGLPSRLIGQMGLAVS